MGTFGIFLKHLRALFLYLKALREIQKILGEEGVYYMPAFQKRPGVKGREIIVPLIPGYLDPENALAFAIHEWRHLIQERNEVSLLSSHSLKGLSLPKKVFQVIRHAEKISPKEGDTEIVERVGKELLLREEIEKFRELMLYSRLPKKIF
jgi:hypothetical protein